MITTESQKQKIYNTIKDKDISCYVNNEVIWTYLYATLIEESINKNEYLNMIFNRQVINPSNNISFWFEAEPISPRKGSEHNTEGNTKLDLAFGGISKREKTKCGIEYSNNEKYVCFIEAKYLSDCSNKVSYDPLRNQIARVIENLLCFQGKNIQPDIFHFALLTPRIFKNNDTTRLYGYKYKEYINNKYKILEDVLNSKMPKRNQTDWKYPIDIEKNLEKLTLNWVAYEDVIEKELAIDNLDIVKLGSNQKKVIEEKLNSIFTKQKEI